MKTNKIKNNNKLNLLLSKIPSVEIILQNKNLQPLIGKSSRKIITEIIRKVVSGEKIMYVKMVTFILQKKE